MEWVGFAAIAFVVIIVAVGVWVFSMSLDKERITDYVQQRGGRVVSIGWAPFGKGWFGEKEERIYEVVYYDKDGNQHFATCKTSFWTGVYWTDDRVTHGKSGWFDTVRPGNKPRKSLMSQLPKEPAENPAEELHRLREENARLREQISGPPTSAETQAADKCPACGARVPPDAARCPDCQIALR